MQIDSIHQEDNQIHCEIYNINSRDDKEEKINDNEDIMNEKQSTNKENQILNETKKEIKNKDENKEKIKNRIMRENNILKKNSNLDKEEGFQTSSQILDSKILGGGSYQTSPENFNPRITEKYFQTSLVNSTPVDCNEGSNQISLRNTTPSYSKESKRKNSLILLENINFPKVGMPKKDNYNQNNTSHITIKELIKRMQSYHPNIKTFCKKKNKPSSKILASTQVQSQEIIEKFMRKRKSKRKEEESNDNMKDISHEFFILSEESKKDRLMEIRNY